jgi:prophage regulatory protein
MNFQHNPRRALRLPCVMERTGLSRTHTYRLIKIGEFPAPHKLSERVSAWNEADIDAWLTAKMAGGVE